jgi:D-alanyl-D-alanine carboxypeptidase (penicillin-binding protein 5/6)
VREGETYATAAVPFAEEQRVGLVAEAGASRVVRLGDGSRFVERVVAPAMVDLPVSRGQKLGEVVILDGDRVVARRDLVADRDVADTSLRDRVEWYADRALDEAGDLLSSMLPGL